MNFLLKRPASLLVCLGLLFTSTGCMVSPGDGEHIGWYQNTIRVDGYTEKPATSVRIEARFPGLGWAPVGYAETSSSPVSWSGRRLYHWHTSVKIPKGFWTFVEKQFLNDLVSVEIRAVDSLSGHALGAFEEGYSEWFDYDQPLVDMWNEHGNGSSATIFAIRAN